MYIMEVCVCMKTIHGPSVVMCTLEPRHVATSASVYSTPSLDTRPRFLVHILVTGSNPRHIVYLCTSPRQAGFRSGVENH